jgi:acyl-CoA thioester hydrolase
MQELKALGDFNIIVQFPVAWSDMDALGHVNSAKYFTYFESARVKYYHNLNLLNYFSLHKIAGVISRTECSYYIQLSYPDDLTIGAKVTELYKDYMIMEYYVKSGLRGLSATGEAEIVFYNFETNKKIFVPQKVADEIIKFENYTVKYNK